ncbi:MAG: transposase [Chitinophagaceae bacterium]|nr:transposase [Chitinophagaceae bacterium]MCR6721607.1 transposase [Chitinophagaceae bacterium]
MKKSRFTEAQIIGILNEQGSGLKVSEICRKHGISEATFHNWKSKYGGLSVDELKRLKELEAENLRLRRLVADLSLDNQILKEINGKKW